MKNKSFTLVSTILIASLVLIGIFLALVYKLATENIYQYVNLLILTFFVLLIISIIIVIFGMYMIHNGKGNKILYLFVGRGMRILFPIYEILAGAVGLKKDEIRAFYIRLNNIIVNSNSLKYRKEDILIILPHCVQNADCQLKVTGDINVCKKCGKCRLKEVTELTEEFGLKCIVVTGGTAARNSVKKFKPKIILSVACERDLSAGIADVNTIPVMGIVNERPNGPCFNTTFDVNELKNAIIRFVENEKK